MSSSCRIIKQNLISKTGDLKLSAYTDKIEEVIDIEYMQKIANEMIESAKAESELILNKAKDEYKEIEKEAYEKGYEQGKKNGYEDGYKQIYDEYIETAKSDAIQIQIQAQELLDQSNQIVCDYLKENQKEIVKSIVNIVEKILINHFEDRDSVSEMVKNIIKKYELNENITIKCNSIYKDSIEINIQEIRAYLEKPNEVFVLTDDSVDKGCVVIQKKSGEIRISIDEAITKLREEILGVSSDEKYI